MILALICSLGFLIAFSLLAERSISLGQLAWILVKVFLGNSYGELRPEKMLPSFGTDMRLTD